MKRLFAILFILFIAGYILLFEGCTPINEPEPFKKEVDELYIAASLNYAPMMGDGYNYQLDIISSQIMTKVETDGQTFYPNSKALKYRTNSNLLLVKIYTQFEYREISIH